MENTPLLYMVDTNHGFLIGTNGGRVETCVGEPQAAPPFTVISSGRAFCTESPAVSASLVFGGVETVTAGTPHSITTIRQDRNATNNLSTRIPSPPHGAYHHVNGSRFGSSMTPWTQNFCLYKR